MKDVHFTEIVSRIFEHHGFFRVAQETPAMAGEAPDLVLTRDGCTWCMAVMASRNAEYTSRRIIDAARKMAAAAKKNKQVPVVAVGGVPDASIEAEVRQLSGQPALYDIRQLLDMARSDRDLYDELVAALPYAVGELEYQNLGRLIPAGTGLQYYPVTPPGGETDVLPPATIDPPQKQPADPMGFDFGNSGFFLPEWDACRQCFPQVPPNNADLCDELRSWRGGKGHSLSADYEKLCTRVLKRLFAGDLTLWSEQSRSNAGLFRFDMICKIRRDNQKDFWEMAERYFNSKYIIFEYKNYARRVTQKEVYTTTRYLYTKALRGVAIIISPGGIDENGGKAIRGVLRDEGKLILSLSNADLIRMLEMQEYGEDPADYLSDRLDGLLIDLEK